MIEYKVIKVTGKTRVIKTEKPLSLERLQKLVGGYIQIVNGGRNSQDVVIVNEEGRINGMLPNYYAEAGSYYGTVILTSHEGI